jgi:hypothetical protein
MKSPHSNSTSPTTEPSVRAVPYGAQSWVTPELIEHTIHVWQPYYKDPLTPDEALAIIQSVGYLIRTLSRESR